MVKNICLIIEGTYPWYVGGVSEWVFQYILAFKDVNFSIIQVSTDEFRRASLRYAVYPMLPNIVEFKRIPVPPHDDYRISTIKKYLVDKGKLKIHSYETSAVIHVTNTGFAGLIGLLLAEELHKPLVLTEHALYWKEVEMGTPALECGYKLPSEKKFKQKYSHLFKNIAGDIYARAEHVISVSRCNMPEQEALGAVRSHYIPNGVSGDWFTKPSRGMTPDGQLTIGWIGRCAEMKDPLRFLSFAEDVNLYSGNQVNFIMLLSRAGENELEKEVMQTAAGIDNVKLMWNARTMDYIDAFDAVCITSKNESQPLILFEALSRNVLPVGWQVGDATEEFGLFIAPGSSNREFIRELDALWGDREEWHGLLKRLSHHVRNHHTWKVIFDQYRNLLSAT